MNTKYRYNPKDFEGIPFLGEELALFYSFLEDYKKSWKNKELWALKNHWEMLFFTIKHRELDGYISARTAEDIRDYLEEVVND